MDIFRFGDIVLLKFPFTDGQDYKRRPAVIINESNDGDVIVCRVTSKIYDSPQDILIEKWHESGLKLPSIIRVHKIATLEKELVELRIGRIDESLRIKIKTILANLAK
jgi:mRNA interferase MazF